MLAPGFALDGASPPVANPADGPKVHFRPDQCLILVVVGWLELSTRLTLDGAYSFTKWKIQLA